MSATQGVASLKHAADDLRDEQCLQSLSGLVGVSLRRIPTNEGLDTTHLRMLRLVSRLSWDLLLINIQSTYDPSHVGVYFIPYLIVSSSIDDAWVPRGTFVPIGHAMEHGPKEPAAWSAPLFEGKISAPGNYYNLG